MTCCDFFVWIDPFQVTGNLILTLIFDKMTENQKVFPLHRVEVHLLDLERKGGVAIFEEHPEHKKNQHTEKRTACSKCCFAVFIVRFFEAWFCWRPIYDLCLILWTSWTTTSRRRLFIFGLVLKVIWEDQRMFFFWPFYIYRKVIDRESSTKRMSALVQVYEVFLKRILCKIYFWFLKCSFWCLLLWRPILYISRFLKQGV